MSFPEACKGTKVSEQLSKPRESGLKECGAEQGDF